MRKSQYRKRQHGLDTEALHNARKERESQPKDERELVKDLSVEDIFFVLTRTGADAFTQMMMNGIESVVEKVVDRKIKEAATGMTKAFEQLKGLAPKAEESSFWVDVKENGLKEVAVAIEDIKPDTKIEPDIAQEKYEAEENSTGIKLKTRRKITWTTAEDQELLELVDSGVHRTKLKAFEAYSEAHPERTKEATAFRYNRLNKQRKQENRES